MPYSLISSHTHYSQLILQNATVLRHFPFQVLWLVGKNAVRLKLPSSINIDSVVHVEHTSTAKSQTTKISYPKPPPVIPYQNINGESLIEVDQSLSYRRHCNGFQFLSLYQNALYHEAEWKPICYILDDNGKLTADLHFYIVEHNLHPELH